MRSIDIHAHITPQCFWRATQDGGDWHTIRRERLERTALVGRVLKYYGLGLKEWAGSSYMLRGSTGKTALVDNMSQMWAEAEKMATRDFDPLDEGLIDYLHRERAS